MRDGLFGWDYPPGVTGSELEITGEGEEEPCEWCGRDPCQCEEYDNMAEIDAEYERERDR